MRLGSPLLAVANAPAHNGSCFQPRGRSRGRGLSKGEHTCTQRTDPALTSLPSPSSSAYRYPWPAQPQERHELGLAGEDHGRGPTASLPVRPHDPPYTPPSTHHAPYRYTTAIQGHSVKYTTQNPVMRPGLGPYTPAPEASAPLPSRRRTYLSTTSTTPTTPRKAPSPCVSVPAVTCDPGPPSAPASAPLPGRAAAPPAASPPPRCAPPRSRRCGPRERRRRPRRRGTRTTRGCGGPTTAAG